MADQNMQIASTNSRPTRTRKSVTYKEPYGMCGGPTDRSADGCGTALTPQERKHGQGFCKRCAPEDYVSR
jgi:hypothetical protein